MTRTQVTVLRVGVFYIWLLTICVAITVLLLLLEWRGLRLNEVQPGFGRLMAVFTPQLSIMCAFFFTSSRKDTAKLATDAPMLAMTAVTLSVIYHSCLIAGLVLGALLGKFGATFDDNMDAILLVAGYLSVFGSAPVAFLFGSPKHVENSPDPNN